MLPLDATSTSAAGGLEKNSKQMSMLTGTYTFDFSKLFQKLLCFRKIEIPELLRGQQLAFDFTLCQIDEVTVQVDQGQYRQTGCYVTGNARRQPHYPRRGRGWGHKKFG